MARYEKIGITCTYRTGGKSSNCGIFREERRTPFIKKYTFLANKKTEA